jgi:hypothetical protein
MSQSQSSQIEHSGASHLLLELANLGAVNVVMFSRAVGIRGTDVCVHCHPREAETTAVMPINFTRLIWASALGYLWFGEFPDIWTWVGGSIVFISTVYITFREG